MGNKIFTDEDYDKAFEDEFRTKIQEIAYYQGDRERITLDGEWSESELRDDLYDEALKILNGTEETKGWLDKNKDRALLDNDLILPEFLVENICCRYDLVEVYNKAYDMHRNDKPMLFGIHYFDDVARKEILKTLNENLAAR